VLQAFYFNWFNRCRIGQGWYNKNQTKQKTTKYGFNFISK